MDNGVLTVNPAEFVSKAFFVRHDIPLDVLSRRYLIPIYNIDSPFILLLGGRQIEKTTTILAKLLIQTISIVGFKSLYVMPLQQQARRVSRLQYTDMVRNTPLLSKMESAKDSSIEEKTFKNQSKIFFLYLSFSADRLRGLPGDYLVFDELQDLIIDALSIVRQSLKHSAYGYEILSGTSKLFSSPTHAYWKKSTGYDWAIKCSHCGTWQFMTPKNIGKEGPICYKCGKPIREDILSETSVWVSTEDKTSKLKGFRINQLMNPDIVKNWERFLWDLEQPDMTEEKLHNEVFGYPYGSGSRPFTEELLKAAALSPVEFKTVEEYDPKQYDTFIGVDWEGEETKTAITVLGFPRSQKEKTVVAMKVFDDIKGMDPQIRTVAKYIQQYDPILVGVDYGMGQDRNPKLIQEFPGKIAVLEYSGMLKAFIRRDRKAYRFIVNRTRAISKVATEMKEGRLRLPPWEYFGRYADHFTSVYRAESTAKGSGGRIYYDHDPGKNDDLLHSLVFAYVSYMIANGLFSDYIEEQ